MAKSRKQAPRRKPAQRRRVKTTALAVRPKVGIAKVLPAQEVERYVTEDRMDLGALGLVELKLSKHEEEVLSEPIDPRRIQWRPREKDGPAIIPYYPHQEYTRWFNRAFGRTGWNLVPIAKPSITRNDKNPDQQTITCPYILHIHGKPVAYAMGEQEYFAGNKQQTYGDALESTNASALRRCAKRLGVGLELWDKGFISALRPQSAPPPPPRRDEPRTYEAPRNNEPPAGHHARASEKITDKQRKRLWVIIRNSGRSEPQVKDWLHRRFGWTSTKDITRDTYDFICKAVESPADLPEASHG